MGRLFLTLLTIASLCFGSGALHIACACGPAPDLSPAPVGDALSHRTHAGCCPSPPSPPSTPDSDSPFNPCDADPAHCPCLYWTSLPVSPPDTLPGAALLKRSLAAAPFLLLEAAPLSLRREAAVIPREGPPGPRDNGTRLQAWICVWTT